MEGIEMTKYEIRFGLVRVSNEEFRTVDYLRPTPELLRSLAQKLDRGDGN